MQAITPFLWFDTQAEEAANFYCSVFPNSRITHVSRYGETGPGAPGSAMVVAFEMNGQMFNALNGGPTVTFNEAVSFVVRCEDQAEVDRYWDRLVEGGAPIQCGWLKDRYGLRWQIVPVEFFDLINQPDQKAVDRVMAAMMQMVKFDVAGLREAAAAG